MQMTLVVLAAGMGSRYGGIKQLEPVGPCGEFILDYSVHDALQAGFSRVVFVIRRNLEQAFRDTILRRLPPSLPVDLVHQELDSCLPPGVQPPQRSKPWGTGHAVLAASAAINEPFAVINADDFYGTESFQKLASQMRDTASAPDAHAMVAFVLANTLSSHGSVARGICSVGPDAHLTSVSETTGIRRQDNHAISDLGPLTGNEPVSMNMWGFKPSIFRILASEFARFIPANHTNPSAEFYLPSAVSTMIAARTGTVTVLQTNDRWFGMTNPADRLEVETAIRALVHAGRYPAPLHSSQS